MTNLTASDYITALKESTIEIIKMGATAEQTFQILSERTNNATARLILMSIGIDLGLDVSTYAKNFI